MSIQLAVTELQPYLDIDVHVSVYPFDVCTDGRLSVKNGMLRLSTEPGLQVPLAEITGVHVAPHGPRELPDEADLAIVAGPRLVEVRSQPCPYC